MAPKTAPAPVPEFTGLDETLLGELPTFELFFKTFGFKRVHGRVWGLLVLAGQPLSSREISASLSLSQGATSTALNELTEWGAIKSEFDGGRRCHLHAPVGNMLSIVATVFRRREQVAIGKLRRSAEATLAYVKGRYGDKDRRVLTLRSLLASLDIAESVMQLVFSSVERALGDSQSILSRAVNAALKVGLRSPRGAEGSARDAQGRELTAGRTPAEPLLIDDDDETSLDDESNLDADVHDEAEPDLNGGELPRAPAPARARVSARADEAAHG